MKPPEKNGKKPSTHRSLLLVDADPLLRWSVEEHLRKWFSVDAVASADEAESVLQRECFDAIVLSASTDGLTQRLEETVRRGNPAVRIVRMVTDWRACEESVSVACVEKPFRLDALTRALAVES